ncbi:MAG: glycosyltransferase family 2 protein [Acidimicrobiales bacterium]|jgi:glycosyltransferase involved in cell wall biosynthesis
MSEITSHVPMPTSSEPAPLVTVVIPAYNAERYLGEAVRSVLGQSWRSLECIVVDDGSTDSTPDIVASFTDERLHYHRKQNEGTVSAARNRGVALASGEFIAFLDSDDVWLPSKLEAQMGLFRSRPELGVVYCAYGITDEVLAVRTVIVPSHNPRTFTRILLQEGNGVAAGSTMVARSDILQKYGGFRVELHVSADAELGERLANQCPWDSVDQCFVLYRVHSYQIHRDLTRFEQDSLWILRDRYGSREQRSYFQRGMANLYTRLFFYELASRHPSAAARHLKQVLLSRPDRLLRLPLEAMVRRSARAARRLMGPPLSPELANHVPGRDN